MHRRSRTPLILVVAGLILMSPGCGEPVEPGARVVAELNGESLVLEQLEAYFAGNMSEDALKDATEKERQSILSRLFDNFIRERILLQEATSEGFQVSDEEVRFYLRMGVAESEEPRELTDAAFATVRQVLIVQKYRESYLLNSVQATPAAVDAYLAETRTNLVPGPNLVLRSLLLASAEEADQVYQEIRHRRMTFAEAVVAHGTEPGQGVPLEMPRNDLPPELKEEIGKLTTGGVSAPVELHGSHYLFQLVSRETAAGVDDAALRVRAEEDLLRKLREEALERLESELRRKTELAIVSRNLPFRYVAEDPEEAGP